MDLRELHSIQIECIDYDSIVFIIVDFTSLYAHPRWQFYIDASLSGTAFIRPQIRSGSGIMLHGLYLDQLNQCRNLCVFAIVPNAHATDGVCTGKPYVLSVFFLAKEGHSIWNSYLFVSQDKVPGVEDAVYQCALAVDLDVVNDLECVAHGLLSLVDVE